MGTLNGKIYIVHGWAYSLEKWEPFLTELKTLGVNPIMLNVPGLTAEIDRPYNIDDYVNWLADKLKDEAGPVTILAHSNGGRISLSYALEYPNKVKNLILIGSAGIYHKDFFITLKRAFFGLLAKLGGFVKENKFVRKVFYKVVREGDYRDANPIMRKTMANLIKVDLAPKLSEIKCPTLLIWGENDGSTPLRDGKIMKSKVPDSELVVLSGARHSPQFTHVSEVISAIKSYYAKKDF